MEANLVTLGQAKKLHALGFKGETHHRWYWWSADVVALFGGDSKLELSCPGAYGNRVWYEHTSAESPRHEAEWVAAPHVVDALEWLEREKGIGFERGISLGKNSSPIVCWSAYPVSGPWLEADTASELLDLVLEKFNC